MSYFSISSPTMSVTYTFAPNTLIRSAQINTNLSTDIVGKSNTNIQAVIDNFVARNLPLGFCENLGVSYSSGVFKLVQSNGSDLASTDGNYAYVSCPSNTSGRLSILKAATSTCLFQDAAHATDSDIIGEEFGVTSGVAWGEDRPFFLYAVNADDTNSGLAFAISPNPCATTSPATTNIGYADTPAATPSDNNFFFLTTSNVTVTHAQKPCVCIGAFRMRMNSSDDWTVQTLSSADGIGRFHDSTPFVLPTGQMGAASGNYLSNNGGTAPVFATNSYIYYIHRTGIARILTRMVTDGGTDGAGAVELRLSLPYKIAAEIASSGAWSFDISLLAEEFPAYGYKVSGNTYLNLYRQTASAGAVQSTLTQLLNSHFTNGSRAIVGESTYRAF